LAAGLAPPSDDGKTSDDLETHREICPRSRILLISFEAGIHVDQDVFAFKACLALLNLALEELRIDPTGVNVEQRRVVVKDLVKKDDELHQVRISLLPERLLAATEQVV
jgi:hypothetical protein